MISDNLQKIKSHLPEGVTLVAVSKYHPLSAILEAYAAGQRIFGESRARDLVVKATAMPADTRWHFIGHLQTNKVRAIVPYVALIHSVDSLRLLQTINREAARIGRVADVLFQIHVAREETKFGFTPQELTSLPTEWQPGDTPNVRLRGLMGMASNTEDTERIREDFNAIHKAYNALKEAYSVTLADEPGEVSASPFTPVIDTLSMGMSDDHLIAVDCGSNMVRVGSAIFAE